MRTQRWKTLSALTAVGVLLAGPAVADEEDAKVSLPRVMMESGEVTNVIDSFDDDDPFDLNITLGFEYSTKSARILRETTIYQPGLTTGGYTSNMMNVGDYSETTTKLIPQLDIGIYKDLAFYVRFPIVLNNARKIDEIDGTAGQIDTVLAGATSDAGPLFTLPFEAPDRSGLEHIAFGLDYDIFNQARDATKPTWLFGVEARVSAGEAMHACTANPGPGQIECADPSDINRNGVFDPSIVGDDDIALEGRNLASDRGPGITRGTFGLEVHTMMSRRVKYIEPYGGISALFEFPMGDNDFGMTDLEGTLVNHPPLRGKITLGMMIIPWENREAFQRLTFDMRFTGEYISEGRDYSELFDALGSSAATSMRNPNWASYRDNCPGGICDPKSVVDTGSQKVYFTGLSDVEAHGSYRGSGSVTWHTGEYFKLTAGLGLSFDQAHGISHDGSCNRDVDNGVAQSGPCHSSLPNGSISSNGVPNPAYRAPINSVGRRFYVDESWTFDIFAKGVVMF